MAQRAPNNAFLALAITFFILGLTSTRAFLPIGIAFLAVALARRRRAR